MTDLFAETSAADLPDDLAPAVYARIAPGSVAAPAPVDALDTPALPPVVLSGDESWRGSRTHVELRRPDRRLPPIRLPLDPARLGELVDIWYRTEGWARVDEMIKLARGNALDRALGPHWGPSTDLDNSRWDEITAAVRGLLRAAEQQSLRIGRPLVVAEELARREVLYRLDATIATVAAEMARLDPRGPYARFADEKQRIGLTPATLAEQLRQRPWRPDPEAPEFRTLVTLLADLGRVRSWAADVRRSHHAKIADAAAAAARSLAMTLTEAWLLPVTTGIAKRLVPGIRQLTDELSGAGLGSAAARIGEEIRFAADAVAAAAQLVVVVEAGVITVFPLARGLDLPALAGRDGPAVARACAEAVTTVVEAAAKVESEIAPVPQSLQHLGESRPDVKTGERGLVHETAHRLRGNPEKRTPRDAFDHPAAVFAALTEAGFGDGTLPWAAATEVMRARGLPTRYMEHWNELNTAGGLASLIARRAGLWAQLSAVGHSTVEAYRETVFFEMGRTSWAATLDPALRLIEAEPGYGDLAMAYGAAAFDVGLLILELALLAAK
ncbi:hypothetical protein KZ829_40980 [Actinoplanes hulinensis]|uniref:Uncharacterized protein n=1 Tax=Actinoplanes hulinensis TaxID=1144547 RepID=A0ABS7BH26_9ACTN|nr:hypothetical protein [Actinoplanes hulinensis]MBW6440118.1 hypothetical protein [Actinoplanes hulinensis]